MATSGDRAPLDYQPRPDYASARGPWWKLRRTGEGRLFAMVVVIGAAIAMLDALYVDYLHARRRALPPPPPPPAASRPTINIHLPPT